MREVVIVKISCFHTPEYQKKFIILNKKLLWSLPVWRLRYYQIVQINEIIISSECGAFVFF